MIAIDTNVLVRIVVDDEKQANQVKIARQFAKKHNKIYISQVVQVELVWVLDFAYKLQKNEIIFVLNHLYENDAFVLQDEKLFAEALHLFESQNCNFADCIIYLQAKKDGAVVITFDKKFAKLLDVQLLHQ